MLPVSDFSWFFPRLYSSFCPLSHFNYTRFCTSHLLTCLLSLSTRVCMTALQTCVWALSSSFFDLLSFDLFEISEFCLFPSNLSWERSRRYWSICMTRELGLSKRFVCVVFHFCCSGSVVPDGCSLFSCQSWGKTKSKLPHGKLSPKISWCVISLH